jgi:hypothetical protein
MKIPARCACHSRTLVAVFVALACAASIDVIVRAQGGPGQNINVVTGSANQYTGDLFRQRQQESVIGISSVNPAHMVVAYNDFRTIDYPNDSGVGPQAPVPGLIAKLIDFLRAPWRRERERKGEWEADDAAANNAWIGLSFTDNGGKSWYSGLHPGPYVSIPPDTDPMLNDAFLLESFEAASDPVMATTHDQFFLGGIAYNPAPGNGKSVGFVSRFTDRNDTEIGQNVHFDGTKVLLKSDDFVTPTSPSFFVDKPSVAAAPGAPGGKAYVYAAFVVFDQSDPAKLSSKILFFRSTDSGQTWSLPSTISQPLSRNQSPWIVVDPNNPTTVYVGWRVFANPLYPTFTNAIVGRKSTNGGASFTPSVPYPVALLLKAFDQPQGNLSGASPTVPSPRSAAYPTATIDGNGAIHVMVQEYVYPENYSTAYLRGLPLAPGASPSIGVPRITSTTSFNGGATWTLRKAIDLGNGAGTQFMPMVAAVGEPGATCPGKSGPSSRVIAMYYDARASNVGVTPGGTGIVAGGNKQFDVRVAQASACTANALTGLSFSPITEQVSQYTRSSKPPFGIVPIKDYPQYTAVNRPYPMNCTGNCAFAGDYIHQSSRNPYVRTTSGAWKLTTAVMSAADRDKLPAPVVQLVWADTRDALLPAVSWGTRQVPLAASAIDALHWELYAPPGTGFASCLNPGSRDQNVYTAEYTPGGLFASAPVTFKTSDIPRSYPLYIENRTTKKRFYKLTIDASANASFNYRNFDTTVLSPPPFAREARVVIGSVSSVTGSIVVGPGVSTPIPIAVEETTSGGAVISPPTGAKTTITLSPAGVGGSNTETYGPTIDPTVYVTKPFLNPGDANGLIPAGGLAVPAGSAFPNPTPLAPNPLAPNPLAPNPLAPNPLAPNPLAPNPLAPNPFPGDVTVRDVTDISYVVTNEGEQTAALNAAASAQNDGNHVFLVLINRAVPTPALNYDVNGNCKAVDTAQAVSISTVPSPLAPNPLAPNPLAPNPLAPNPLAPNYPPEDSNTTFYVAPAVSSETLARLAVPNSRPGPERVARRAGDARIQSVGLSTPAVFNSYVADRPKDFVVVTIRDILIGPGTPLSPAQVKFIVRAEIPNNHGGIFAATSAATGTQIPHHLAFIVQPTTSAAGATIAPPVQVAIKDAFGSTVTSATLPVTMAINNNPSGGTLAGTLSRNAVAGVATFDDLAINNLGAGYTVMASSAALQSATSNPFNIAEPLTIVTGALPEGTQDAPYSQNVVAHGGVPPYAWDIKQIPNNPQFNLPVGLALTTLPNGSALISGTPTVVQVRSFRVRVTDASGQTATQDLCLHVEESPGAPPLVAARNPDMTAAAIAQMLVGEDHAITISNVTYSGASGAVGTFTGGFSATGLNSGVILSSGAVANVNPPNDVPNKGTSNNGAGDSDLEALIPGFITHDAAVLEFDFIVTDPQATSVKFDYVFASEEYNEFVFSTFNDVFGFFMSGPNFPKTNLALVPNTSTPVSIDNVNGGNPFGSPNARNATEFVNNEAGLIGTQADGLTRVFSISANIVPAVMYHLKIGIADAGDTTLDSFVMIKAGSFSSVCPIIPQ